MKSKLLTIFLIAILVGGTTLQSRADVSINFNFFYNNLAPQGRWVFVPNYGEVWSPLHVSFSWRPYSNGRWVWTNDGWMWISYSPWGTITDHYGRWVYEANYGWLWIPGAVWAPAWVTWYVGPSYVGWAPLPPYAYIRIVPRYCVFVPFHAFLSVNLYHYYVPVVRNVTIIHYTTHITNIAVIHNVIINRGPNVNLVERRTHVFVHPLRLVSTNRISYEAQRGTRIYVYRPHVAAAARFRTPLLKIEAEKGVVQVGRKRLFLNNEAAKQHPYHSFHAKPRYLRPRPHPQKHRGRRIKFHFRKEVK